MKQSIKEQLITEQLSKPFKIGDEDVLNVFLGINHTGTPMSEEHINYVKSLRK